MSSKTPKVLTLDEGIKEIKLKSSKIVTEEFSVGPT